ncbi:hypothetical protein CA267_001990 [Alteromonas pelagimontana]|uniref:Uncharacterized protein n=1 Tax=Alteromonas pelagimontana TaxID=1858656 RepID=A0A6M4M8Y7_9ALTE|nr:hypothetical protein [Alteromonas pelagimontana]QJR79654.1 hypothetical protein CA267_001990 [Alteromonas pelagimontana]
MTHIVIKTSELSAEDAADLSQFLEAYEIPTVESHAEVERLIAEVERLRSDLEAEYENAKDVTHDMRRLEIRAEAAEKRADELKGERNNLREGVNQLCVIHGIGEKARNLGTLSICVSNAHRFSGYLHAVINAHFVKKSPIDDAMESAVSVWGAKSKEHVVEEFGRALAARDLETQIKALESLLEIPLSSCGPVKVEIVSHSSIKERIQQLRQQQKGVQ